MVKSRLVFVLLVIAGGLFFLGCRSGTELKASAASQGENAYDLTNVQAVEDVIGHLKTRGMWTTIRAGSHGPLFTVKSMDGEEILATNLSEEELAHAFPELEFVLNRGLAIWAGD